MSAVAALYRYPVKGMTPEPRDRLTVLDSGAIAGDRVLGLLHADAGPPVRGGWWPKQRFVVLMNTPGLARLDVRFDDAASRLSVALDGATLVEDGLDDAGRARVPSMCSASTRARCAVARSAHPCAWSAMAQRRRSTTVAPGTSRSWAAQACTRSRRRWGAKSTNGASA